MIDEIVVCGNQTAFDTARLVARVEGIPVGISAGAAVAAAIDVGRRPENAGKMIVIIIPRFRRALSLDRALRRALRLPRLSCRPPHSGRGLSPSELAGPVKSRPKQRSKCARQERQKAVLTLTSFIRQPTSEISSQPFPAANIPFAAAGTNTAPFGKKMSVSQKLSWRWREQRVQGCCRWKRVKDL